MRFIFEPSMNLQMVRNNVYFSFFRMKSNCLSTVNEFLQGSFIIEHKNSSSFTSNVFL